MGGIGRSSVYVVGAAQDCECAADSLTSELIGVKAYGLLPLPVEWVPPFFCIEDGVLPDENRLVKAAQFAGLDAREPLYVRSSGTKEGIDERGALCSEEARIETIVEVLGRLLESDALKEARKLQKVHFIIQRKIRTQAKGHLSNERRIARKSRDWVAEIEPSLGHLAESGSVAVRRWRSVEDGGAPLACDLRANLYRVLRGVAAWAGIRRLHLEWVWDGLRIWIVQCEEAKDLAGVVPSDLAKKYVSEVGDLAGLRCFRKASAPDFSNYGKLKNARVYRDLGYAMPPFFILNDQSLIKALVLRSEITEDLEHDLKLLCKAPLVLRTDGTGIPAEKRQMLPRSDELRSSEEAKSWLLEVLPERLSEINVEDAGLALIGHHFLPAVSSAWCLAYPDRRRVRIESLWGIPEGLYYFPHDVFDVFDVFDVDVADVNDSKKPGESVRIVGQRERYKEKFIAPDASGKWVIHSVANPHDWGSSVGKNGWVREIAHTSRRIAIEAQHPVVVMWFIGLVDQVQADQVLPWYHEPWTPVQEAGVSSEISRATKPGETRTIKTSADLDELIARGAGGATRIAIEPEETGIVRDQKFIERLSAVAKENGYIVELRGGLLSHVYYTLKRDGIGVVCVDAFATDDETIEFNKLVRDKIPEKIEAHGESAEVAKLEGEALLAALKNKLVEEAFEVMDAKSTEAMSEEIADVIEVLHALEDALGLARSEVEALRDAKKKKRGGFREGVMLLNTRLSTPTSGELVTGPKSGAVIREVSSLPSYDPGVNIDKRAQGGDLERLLTFSMPAYATEFKLARQSFDLATQLGHSHPMRFEVLLQRSGADQRVRFKLTNSAYQLDLFPTASAPVNGEGTD
ncbi:hypothetical protein ACIPR8_09035 [Stenotrophomonas sp. LARHCG68]